MYLIAFDETRCDANRLARCDWLRKDDTMTDDTMTNAHEGLDHRGRAALPGRVSPVKSAWASAPVALLPHQIAFFRSLLTLAPVLFIAILLGRSCLAAQAQTQNQTQAQTRQQLLQELESGQLRDAVLLGQQAV